MSEFDQNNFLRLVTLLWKHGSSSLQQFLRKLRISQGAPTLSEWLMPKKQAILKNVKGGNSEGNKPLNRNQFNKLFPKDKEPVEEDLDITLLTYLIDKFCTQALQCGDFSKHIKEIRLCRNEVAHSIFPEIDEDRFEEMWRKIEKAIIYLDPERERDVEIVRRGPLDVKLSNEYWEKLMSQYEEEIATGFGDVLDSLDEVKLMLHQVLPKDPQQNQANDKTIMKESEPFFNFESGRLKEDDIEKILNCRVPNKSVIVHSRLPSESILFKDIVSLWNTPDREKAYILLGVKPSYKMGKAQVVGLKPSDHPVKQFSFMNDKFLSSIPEYIFYEFSYFDQDSEVSHRIAIFEIANSKNSSVSPAIIKQDISFDDGITLEKDVLWARIGSSNEIIGVAHATYTRIMEWFNEDQNEMLSEEEKEMLEGFHNPSFCNSMGRFQSGRNYGHYILILGKMDAKHQRFLKSITKIPWLLVLDFDDMSLTDGLYHSIQKYKNRLYELKTMKDKHVKIEAQSPKWVFLRGTPFIPSEKDPKKWFKESVACIRNITEEMEKFSNNGYNSVIKILLLWNKDSKSLEKHLQRFLEVLDIRFADVKYVKLIACSDDEMSCLEELSMEEVCFYPLNINQVLANMWKETSDKNYVTTGYLLPMKEPNSENNPKFNQLDILKIEETLDVLYLNKVYEYFESTEELENVEKEFLKGGSISWETWQKLHEHSIAVPRSCFDDIKTEIICLLKNQTGSRMVEILHSPSGGGTILAMQLLWSIHKEYPCVQVKSKVMEKSNTELAELIEEHVLFIYQKTGLPLLVLIDEPDNALLNDLKRMLMPFTAVILFTRRRIHVKATALRFKNPGRLVQFDLSGKLDQAEARLMIVRLSKFAPEQKLSLKKLEKTNSNLIEFNLTAFIDKFKGVKTFVFNIYSNLNSEQKTVCKYLSFIDVYAHRGSRDLELQRFFKVMGVPEGEMLHEEKIETLLQYLVKPSNSSEDTKIKMVHNILAKEVLRLAIKEIRELNQQKDDNEGNESSSCALSILAEEFIDFIIGDCDKVNDSDRKVLTNVFLDRDTQDSAEDENRKRFTQIIMEIKDIDDRRRVLEKVRDKLKLDPHAHAHLGRFNYLGRDDYKEAETCFEEALRLVKKGIESCSKNKTSSDRIASNSARVVYNMYAFMDLCLIRKRSSSLASNNEEIMKAYIKTIKRGIEHFTFSRELYTKPEYEHYFTTFLAEANMRLEFCSAISKKGIIKIQELYSPLIQQSKMWKKDAADIMINSAEIIDQLIYKASRCVEEHDSEANDRLLTANLMYKTVFDKLSAEKILGDTKGSRRLQAAMIKKKYLNRLANKPENSDYYGSLTNVSGDDLKTVIKLHEQNILEEKDPSPLAIDLREWMTGIRLADFKQDHSPRHVLKILESCLKNCRSPLVIFYTAVVSFIVGIGSEKKNGDLECYGKSLRLMQQLKDLKHRIQFSRNAKTQEWLGRRGGIKRLIRSYRGRPLGEENLSRCTGYIKPPNVSDFSGLIYLEKIDTIDIKTLFSISENLGPESTLEVFMSFFPKKKDSLSGKKYALKKVRFNLMFSIEKGFEARNVFLAE